MKFDLHTHTFYSDGIAAPEEIVEQAKRMNLDGIAITDHDNMKGLKRAKKTADALGLILIPATEITLPMGDILAYGIEEMPKYPKNASPIEIMEKIHEMGGVTALAHPFGGYWPISFAEVIGTVKSGFDAIEIFNACVSLEANIAAMEMAKKIRLPGIAGSDAHTADLVGTAFTACKKDILSEIKKGKIEVGWI